MAIEEEDHTPTPVLLTRALKNVEEIREIIEVLQDRNSNGCYGDGALLAITSRLDESKYTWAEVEHQIESLEDDLRGLDYSI